MKNWMTISLLAILALIPIKSEAASVSVFIVNERSSDGVLLQNKYGDVYFVETFVCSIYEGDTVLVETNFLGEPSMFGKITKPGSYFDTTCNISSAHEVTHKLRVTSVFDSDDKILVDFGGIKYLVEYGIGCGLSMWRYEDDDIYLNLGGSLLDGIGDNLVLPNGDDCSVWDVEEIDGGSNYSPTYIPSCPANSSENPNNPDKCICNAGYELNAAKNACVPYVPCPTNSYEDPTNNSICICNGNYQWDSSKTKCELKPKVSTQNMTTPKKKVSTKPTTQSCKWVGNQCKCVVGYKLTTKNGKKVCTKK